MSELMTVSNNIAQTLKDAGLTAFPYIPARINPPLAVIAAGSPFVSSEGVAFGEFKTRWEITVIAPTGANDVSTEKLYDLVEDSIVALVNSKYIVDEAGKAYALEANGAMYAAIDIKINTNVRI